jgi:FkbM family methyltransferase
MTENTIVYEPETIRIFDAILKEGDRMIIAGAHQGFFVSHCAGLVGKTGMIYGFEPEPENFKILYDKTKDLQNVTIFNHALGDRKALAKLYINSDNDGGHALWDVSDNPNNVKTQTERKVLQTDVKTIDSLFPEGLQRLKLLMLDAEGSELSIIKGGINTIIDSEVPYIICEMNKFALEKCHTSQMNMRSYLSIYDYIPYIVMKDKVVDCNKDEVVITIPGTEQVIVFNMLFSKQGKV